MRGALLAICLVLSACGGGGSDAPDVVRPAESISVPAVTEPQQAPATVAEPAPQPTPTPQPAPINQPAPVPASPPANIAAWGDSLTVLYAPELSKLYSDRTVYNGGVGGETSSQVLMRIKADTKGRNAWINVFMLGRNNYQRPDEVRADIAAAVAWLATGNDKFVVLSVLNGAFGGYELKGGAGYQQITTLNASLAALYADRYLDVRAFLVSQYDPTNQQDAIDYRNDIIPSSLRKDQLHLNERGSQLLAEHVRDYIKAMGW